MNKFSIQDDSNHSKKYISKGLFGYMTYDSVRFFEKININNESFSDDIPDIYYSLYSEIIVVNTFNNEANLISHSGNKNKIDEIEKLITRKKTNEFSFKLNGKLESNLTDDEFLKMVDNGSFKIFGSSPEAQLVIKDKKAEIHPIAGTFKRSGDDAVDKEKAIKLFEDDKENSEHMMLVDLARNDLSRSCSNVKVEKDREIQFYSHVIHLVSKVTGELKSPSKDIIGNTFPAGTLTGAPKFRAMELIEEYENHTRSFYGGAIGFIDFDNNFNHAIMIRSFLSKNQNLLLQAGAGIVSKSNRHNELNEVYNKIGALLKALEKAEEL
jgi:anthranilate synthase component 1